MEKMKEEIQKLGFDTFEQFVESDKFKTILNSITVKDKIDGGKHSDVYYLNLNDKEFIFKKAIWDQSNKQYKSNLKNEKSVSDKARNFLSENIVVPEIYYVSEDNSFLLMEYIRLKKIKSFENFSTVLKTLSVEQQKELGIELGHFFKNFSRSEVIVEERRFDLKSPDNSKKEELLNKISLYLNLSTKSYSFLSHRDIHENNILFTEDNKIAILDWEAGNFDEFSTDINHLIIHDYLDHFNTELLKAYREDDFYKKIELTKKGRMLEFYAPDDSTIDLFEELSNTVDLLYDLKLKEAIKKLDLLEKKYKKSNTYFSDPVFVKNIERILNSYEFKNLDTNNLKRIKALLSLKNSKEYRKEFLKLGIEKTLDFFLNKISNFDQFIYSKTNLDLHFNLAVKRIRELSKNSFKNTFKDQNENE